MGRLLHMFNDQRGWAQLGHIATDGETYGHHHRHADMALARALRLVDPAAPAVELDRAELGKRKQTSCVLDVQVIRPLLRAFLAQRMSCSRRGFKNGTPCPANIRTLTVVNANPLAPGSEREAAQTNPLAHRPAAALSAR